MDETYYTDKMRKFVNDLENIHDFPVEVRLNEDEDGTYVCLVFSAEDHHRFGQDRLVIEEVAEYLVDLRNGLIDLGARVTFWPTGQELK